MYTSVFSRSIASAISLLMVLFYPNAHAQVAATHLYWVQSSGTAANDQLVRSDLNGGTITVLASGATNFNNPVRLSVDQARSTIYVVDQPAGTGGIYRFDINGGTRTVIAATSASFTYQDIQVAGNYIYWVQSSGTASNDQLVRANLDGTGVTVLASGATNFTNPVNLTVDLTNQYIYVADQPAASGLGIIRYDLTGGNRTVVAAPNAGFTYNDLQTAGGYLYWVQSSGTAASDQLVRANLDGSSPTVLASGASNFNNPVTVTVDATLGYIYVGDQPAGTGGLYRFDLTGGSRTVVAATSASFTYQGLSLNTDYNSPYTTSVSVPANGTYKIGDNLNFTVNWNTAVTVTGSPYIPLTIGAATKNAAYLSGTGTTATVFRYTVASGDFDNNGIGIGSSITLNGGTIQSGSLNASLTLNNVASTASVNVDGVTPSVSSINRQNPVGQTTTSSTLVWRITFSESVVNVDVSDFELTQVSGSPTGTIASVSASSGTAIDVTVNSVSGNGTLRLDLKSSGTGITDAAGNPISGGFTSGQTYIIPTPGLWTGASSTNFNTAANWDDNTVPTSTTDITIPGAASNMPVLSATASVRNITLQTGASISLAGQTLTVTGNISVAGTGKLIGSSSSVLVLTGTGASTLTFDQTADGSSNALGTLTLNGSGAVHTLTGKLHLYSLLTLTAANLNLNGNTVLLKSISVAGTAMVGPLSGTITYGTGGRFMVERYIPMGKRAYRLLAPGVSGSVGGTTASTIYQNWQNGGVYAAGIGTHVSGDGNNGTDLTQTTQPSLFTFTPGSLSFTPVTSTNQPADTLSAIKGYRIFIRGDRDPNNLTQNNNSGTGTPNINLNVATTLSAAGRLLSGTIVFNSTATTISGADGWQWQQSNSPITTNTGTNNSYSLIPNPYQAMVDWNAVTLNSLSTTYYTWNPNKGLRGGYESYNRTGSVASSAEISRYIQPGQAFFVQTTGAAPSLTISESNKNTSTANLLNAFRTQTSYPNIEVQLLYNSRGAEVVDNVKVLFDDSFSEGLGNEDSYKQQNPDDNIAILQDNAAELVFEGRKPVTAQTIIPLRLYGLQKDTGYIIMLNASNITPPAGYNAYLEDAFTNTSTQLSLSGSTSKHFIPTGDSLTFYNRFSIVFRTTSPLPVTISTVKAYQKGSGIQVAFTNASESGVRHYEVEESADGRSFIQAAKLQPKGNNGTAAGYEWFDGNVYPDANYYRIKAVANGNDVKYSAVVKVNLGNKGALFSVYPNPVAGNNVTVSMNELAKGTYTLEMFNKTGQKVMSRQINHSGGNASENISLPVLAQGMYTMQLKGRDVQYQLTIIVQ